MTARPAASPSEPSSIYEALFELAPDAILVVDGEGRVLRMNAHAESVFGYGRDIRKPEQSSALHRPAGLERRHKGTKEHWTIGFDACLEEKLLRQRQRTSDVGKGARLR